MDLLDSLRALLRRWPVTLTLLVVTLAATVGALVAIPWQYESTATVVFLSSRKGSQPVGGNPWLAFDGSLTITAEVISRGMSDERTLQRLKEEGDTADYTVGLAQDSRGPLLDITATGPDPKVAQRTMETLAALSQERLTEMQKKSAILPDATIRAELVTSTDEAQLTPQKKIRLLVIVFAGGMLLTVGVPLFLESLAQKRRRLAQGEQETTGPIVPPPSTPPASSQHVTRSPAAAPRSRPPVRRPRPIEPAEPRVYDHRVTGKQPPARRPSPPEPKDPWEDQQQLLEDGFTAPIPAIKVDNDLYVWADDKDRPLGAPPAGGNGAGQKQGPQTTGGADPDDEPYVVFDPTRPGR
ncbi:hypothetical protein [Sphaerisporangium fuscum]|uniref:hypothetical protein n=1 Tax=Sphaerisporangium fuscum TaxID=2835868 RepID=UPI001BDD4625|nr:hypothetical protein [Sphaerisporangium fuscum]